MCFSVLPPLLQPMMEHVRIHPELVTGSKDHELDPRRYIYSLLLEKTIKSWFFSGGTQQKPMLLMRKAYATGVLQSMF